MIRRLPSRKAAVWIAEGRYVAVEQTFNGTPRLVAVPVGSVWHKAAVEGVDGWALPPMGDYRDDAVTFADVAHDNAGMVKVYDLLEQQTVLWASAMPAGTPKAEALRYMTACIDALAARMREIAADVIVPDAALVFGVCCGSDADEGGDGEGDADGAEA